MRNLFDTDTEVLEKEKVVLKEHVLPPMKIVLHNDDKNSFDWVIECLMKYCKHEYEQATQCAWITHHNGKCDVKVGEEPTLRKIKNILSGAGLTVTLEKN